MINPKKKLCIYIHFGTDSRLPESVLIYINELKKFYEHFIIVTNERSISNENEAIDSRTTILQVKNEGYDLGMFYKAFQTINPEEFDQIACINDSNVLINELKEVFDWSKKKAFDFWGIIDSHQKPEFSTHADNYHIQSHFLIFNKRAISLLPVFFERVQIQEIYEMTDQKRLRETVINTWEIGLSQFFIHRGLTCGSFINSHSFSQLYGAKAGNATLKLYPELIRAGYPLLKKKVITKGKVKDIFRNQSHWKNLVRQYGNENWEIDRLLIELHHLKASHGNQPLMKVNRQLRKIAHRLKNSLQNFSS